MKALTLYKKMDSKFRIKLGVAIISGLMLTASFPPGKLDWMAWIALVPLFWTLKDESPSRAFKLGFIAGVAHYVTLIYWIVVVLEHYGGLPYFISFFILLIFLFLPRTVSCLFFIPDTQDQWIPFSCFYCRRDLGLPRISQGQFFNWFSLVSFRVFTIQTYRFDSNSRPRGRVRDFLSDPPLKCHDLYSSSRPPGSKEYVFQARHSRHDRYGVCCSGLWTLQSFRS